MAKPTSPAPPTPPLPFQQKPQPGADSTQPRPRLAAAPNPSQIPSRRSSDLMLPGTRKRGHAAAGGGPALLGDHGLGCYARPDPSGHSGGGGGGHGDDGLGAALIDALGLGSFARLDLPAPPDGLDLTAAVKPSSGTIVVSMGGDSITAWPADLAAALSLRLDRVPLAAEVDAAVFSSAEAIAAVRVFVRDRLLLGGTGDGQALPEEAVAALRLVEEGKAYEVDWGWLVWAFLRSDVLIGKRRRCGQYLLRLMMCQRPDLFSGLDGRFLGKRRKGLILQQEETLLFGDSGYDRIMAAEAGVEEGLVSGLGKNVGGLGKMPAFRYNKDQQHRIGTEDQEDDNVNVGPSLPSSYASQEQALALAHVSNMENVALDSERTSIHTLAEIQHLKENEKDKDNQIYYIVKETEKELQARATKMKQFEHDKMVMACVLHGYKKMLQESSAAFSEYRKMICEESGVSSFDVVADEKNQVRLMQQLRHAHEIINGIQKPVLSKFSACAKKITLLLPKLADLNNEVQRLNDDSRSIPDLNVGPHL